MIESLCLIKIYNWCRTRNLKHEAVQIAAGVSINDGRDAGLGHILSNRDEQEADAPETGHAYEHFGVQAPKNDQVRRMKYQVGPYEKLVRVPGLWHPSHILFKEQDGRIRIYC